MADCLIMIPALAQGSVAVWEVTRATTVPSPARVWESYWNWSAVPPMSDPDPLTVNTPLA